MTQKTRDFMPASRQRKSIGLLALSLLVGLLPFYPAHAGDATLEAQIAEDWDYNSNPLMALDHSGSVYGSVTHGGLTLKSKTPTTMFALDAGVKQNIFNKSGFNSTDLHGGLNATQTIERWSAGLQGLVDYDTTRNSELSANGTDVGNVRHLGLTATPQITFHPTPIDALFMTGSATTSRYDNSAYSNYYVVGVSPGYTHNFTPRNAGTFMVQLQHYRSSDTDHLTVDTISPTVGWTTTLSPELTASAAVGTQTSQQRSSTAATTSWAWQYVFVGNLAYQNEVNHVNFRATREQYPFSNGTQSLLTTFSATGTHAINPSFDVGLTASYQDATYQVTPTGISLRSLVSGGPSLIYHLTERFDLSANYLYRRETLINSDKTVQDHASTLSLVYHPPAWRL